MGVYKNILTSLGAKRVERFAFAHKSGESEIRHAIYIKDSLDMDLDLDKDESFDSLDINIEDEEIEIEEGISGR